MPIDASILKKIQENDETLTYLGLGYNSIGSAGAKALAHALKVNNSLTNLDLRYNNIDDVGIKELADTLKVNNSLTVLDLVGNYIGDVGAKELANAFKFNKSIGVLNIMFNKISNVGIKSLCNGLENNFTLLKLQGISAPVIQGYLQRNNMLAELFYVVKNTFSCQLGELIDGDAVRNFLNELMTIENLNLESIDDSLFPKEFYRLLTGLAYLSNYQTDNRISSLVAAFGGLTPAFKNAQLQSLAHEALLASINALYAKTVEEQNPNRKTELLQNVLYALRPYTKSPDIQLIAYDAFAQLEKNGTSISPLDIYQYQETRALLSYEKALTTANQALTLCQHGEEKNEYEIDLLIQLLKQKEYQPFLIPYFFKSPSFVFVLKKQYPQKECVFIEECLLSEQQESITRVNLERAEDCEHVTTEVINDLNNDLKYSPIKFLTLPIWQQKRKAENLEETKRGYGKTFFSTVEQPRGRDDSCLTGCHIM